MGVRVQAKPEGDTVEARVIVPVNPLTGATVMVDAVAVPGLVVTEVGLAVTV